MWLTFEKQCPACGETKESSEFSGDFRQSDGLKWCCKTCDNRRRRARYCLQKVRPNTAPSRVTTKVCTACRQEKPLDAFSRHPGNPLGLQAHCKPCVARRVATYKRRKRSERQQAVGVSV